MATDQATNRNVEQDLAANPASSAWVSASAGTGKTHVLDRKSVV